VADSPRRAPAVTRAKFRSVVGGPDPVRAQVHWACQRTIGPRAGGGLGGGTG
jgi:hypothetical protein